LELVLPRAKALAPAGTLGSRSTCCGRCGILNCSRGCRPGGATDTVGLTVLPAGRGEGERTYNRGAAAEGGERSNTAALGGVGAAATASMASSPRSARKNASVTVGPDVRAI